MPFTNIKLLDKKTKQELMCIAVLVVLVFCLFGYQRSIQIHATHTPKIINLAGKQRMLSQRISYLQHLVITDTVSESNAKWRAEMRLLLEEFESSYLILTGKQPLAAGYTLTLTEELNALYGNAPDSLDELIVTFLTTNKGTSSAKTDERFSFYTPEQSAIILGRLDTATFLYEQQGQAFAEKIGFINLCLWVLSAAIFVLAYRSILRPLKLQIQKQSKEQLEILSALENAKQELEYQLDQRSLYIQKIAHDLRSPVSAVISVLDLLPNSKGETSTLLRQGEMACQRLLKYTDDLADIIKPHADTGVKRQCNLISLFDDSFSKCSNSCEIKGLAFDVTTDKNLPKHIISYPRVIRKCIENILENAVLYTSEGSIHVDIKLVDDNTERFLTVAVTDTGVGIPRHHVDLIFERFKRLPTDNTGNEKLTGVGLAIAKECLDAIGGDITVFSHLDHGSTFTFQIPYSLASISSEFSKAQNEVNKKVKFAVIDDFDISRQHLEQLIVKAGYQCDVYHSSTNFFEHKEKISGYEALIIDYYMPGLNGEELVLTLNAMLDDKMPRVIMVSSSPDIANIVAHSRIKAWQVFTKPIMENRFIDALDQLVQTKEEQDYKTSANILLVEDEKINAEMMVQMLTNMGYVTKMAPDGQTALSLYQAYTFDCVLLDIHLPDIDGISLIEKLKDISAETPIIVISGDTADETEMVAIEAGVRYYMFKPVSFQELKNTLQITLSLNASTDTDS